MFVSSKTKGSECPCKLHFSLYKVGFSSVPIAHTCLHDDTDFELQISLWSFLLCNIATAYMNYGRV